MKVRSMRTQHIEQVPIEASCCGGGPLAAACSGLACADSPSSASSRRCSRSRSDCRSGAGRAGDTGAEALAEARRSQEAASSSSLWRRSRRCFLRSSEAAAWLFLRFLAAHPSANVSEMSVFTRERFCPFCIAPQLDEPEVHFVRSLKSGPECGLRTVKAEFKFH